MRHSLNYLCNLKMKRPAILLLEDDIKLCTEIKFFLDRHHYDCSAVYDGISFLKQKSLHRYQLYILDINTPGLNGIEVCKKIREEDSRTPILMLTAYSAVEDKVQALNFGADDYLVKPFHFDELDARLKALLRRTSVVKPMENVYRIGDLVIDAAERRVSRGNKEIHLTPKEYKLLELLAESGGQTISKRTIAEQVWDINFETGTNTVEVYISFLRNKIDKGFAYPLIHTRAGYGYYLKEKE